MLSGANGSFTSPGFPLTYPVSVKCTWIIEVPEDHRVQLTFTTFQLENCAVPSLCTCDHVQVRDGRDGNAPELRELCGDNIPATLRLQSSGRYLWVEFESDSKTVGNGFDAFFKAVRKYAKIKTLRIYQSFFYLWATGPNTASCLLNRANAIAK